jgi:hypothetical protein
MDMLRGLRLNCWLAPLAAAAAGIGGIGVVAHAAARSADTASAEHLMAAQSALAAGEATGTRPSVAQAQRADPRWRCLAVVDFTSDRIVIREHAGTVPELQTASPPPELTFAVGSPQAWSTADDGRAVAVALHGPAGELRGILYGEAGPEGAVAAIWRTAVMTAAGLALLAVFLSWYLVRRIYLPIQSLARQAEAVLAGRPVATAATRTSVETAVAASSLTLLIERHATGAAPPPPP